ncbi:hypothetical protein SLEP1_g35232 [Rubroshorea leprosula]|uniref:DUF1664 domain-containing protein n=1 Tax=Rubroshorea leprosula TaxID=152421 RepID=A0AAV5KMK4_9ROSI|nr:hypothetical protein SLEP1_g35232 [Rubroshorea leprosula]
MATTLAQHAGKFFLLAGAGYTTTFLINNGKLSVVLGELRSSVMGIEKRGEQSDDYSDPVVAQVRRLAMEVRQLASARQITVFNRDSEVKLTSLLAPAAALGAFGYGYMWWKGISCKDLLWVTKHNMAAAVENLSKHLESVSSALSEAKQKLTERIKKLGVGIEEQKKVWGDIQASVEATDDTLSDAKYNLDKLHALIFGLDGRLDSLEEKQDFMIEGVNFVAEKLGGKNIQMPDDLLIESSWNEQFKLISNSRNLLPYFETPSIKGLKDVVDSLTESINDSKIDALMQDGIDGLDNKDNKERTLQRFVISTP